jgi:hypothetical protein
VIAHSPCETLQCSQDRKIFGGSGLRVTIDDDMTLGINTGNGCGEALLDKSISDLGRITAPASHDHSLLGSGNRGSSLILGSTALDRDKGLSIADIPVHNTSSFIDQQPMD